MPRGPERAGQVIAGHPVLRGGHQVLALLAVLAHHHQGADLHYLGALGGAHFGRLQEVLDAADAGLHEALLLLGRLVVGVLPDVPVGAGLGQPLFGVAAPLVGEALQFLFELAMGAGGEPGGLGLVGHGRRREGQPRRRIDPLGEAGLAPGGGLGVNDSLGGRGVETALRRLEGLGGGLGVAGLGGDQGVLGPGLQLGPNGLVAAAARLVLAVALDLRADVGHGEAASRLGDGGRLAGGGGRYNASPSVPPRRSPCPQRRASATSASSPTSTTASRPWPIASWSAAARSATGRCASRCSTPWTWSGSGASPSRPRRCACTTGRRAARSTSST